MTEVHPVADGDILLEGVDGGTPLGFLAALGVLQVLADRRTADAAVPRLAWRSLDAWRPAIRGQASFDAIVDAVARDARAWETAPILSFRYLKLEKRGPKPFGGLAPPLAVLRGWLLRQRDIDDDASRRSLSQACALMCETAGRPLAAVAPDVALSEHDIPIDAGAPFDRAALPTYFDFTSRNAQFLDQIALIRGHIELEGIVAALRDGRPDHSATRTMDWDPGADTPGAIYTGYARGFHPVLEWLAFRGLAHFPVTGTGEVLETTACSGRRKSGVFTWPLWHVAIDARTVRSLVAYPQLDQLDADSRTALGIAAIYHAGLIKKADGYSGMFSPARPC